MLDYSSFQKSLALLEKAHRAYESEAVQSNPETRELMCASAVQAFELTYETCTITIRRQLEVLVPSRARLEVLPFLDMIRTAADYGLVLDPIKFKYFRKLRNITVHTYNAGIAEEVVAGIPEFLSAMRHLRSELERLNPPDA